METHAQKAARLFREGLNCAQAVFCAYGDLTGLDRQTSIRLSASFGGGMGRLREVCGSVSGALMVLGMLRAPLDPTDHAAKAAHYALIQEFAKRFRERHASIICREILGTRAGSGYVPEKRSEEYYAMRPCEHCVYDAAEIIEAMLHETHTDCT